MVTIRSPFCGYNTTSCVELKGEDLSRCSNKIESVSLRKCPHDHRITNNAYLSAITVTNICQSFAYKMAAKINWHRCGTKLRHYVALCIATKPTFKSKTNIYVNTRHQACIFHQLHSRENYYFLFV